MDESVKMDLEDLARQNRICYFPVFAGLLSAAPGLAEKLPYCSNVSLYKENFITLYRLLADHAFSRCIVTYNSVRRSRCFSRIHKGRIHIFFTTTH